MKRKILKAIDLALASVMAPVDSFTDRLVVLAFHAVLPDLSSLNADAIDPYQPLTLQNVEDVILQLKARGYTFVTGQDLAAQEVKGPAVWLTFDDGYANNLALAPLLARLGAKATIFVATHYIDTGEAYWWDVLYRESRRRGVADSDISARREALKTLPPERIRAEVAASFGQESLRPTGDIDRPMTPEELVGVARAAEIEIGNHTHHHTILPVVDAGAQHADIALCQDRLHAIIGTTPLSIAYPNGDMNTDTAAAARQAGLSVGVTCTPRQFVLTKLARGDSMQIGRFAGLRHGVMSRELKLATARMRLSA